MSKHDRKQKTNYSEMSKNNPMDENFDPHKDPEVKDPEVKDPEVKDPEVKDPEVKDPEVKDPENVITSSDEEGKDTELKAVEEDSVKPKITPNATVNVHALSLRKQPIDGYMLSIDYPLMEGEGVKIIKKIDEEWAYVDSDLGRGYVKLEYLKSLEV